MYGHIDHFAEIVIVVRPPILSERIVTRECIYDIVSVPIISILSTPYTGEEFE